MFEFERPLTLANCRSITERISDWHDIERLMVVDIPTGYTHSITNVGRDDLVTVMWASESFDPLHPDTFYEEV